jgi:molecular chaperone DnaJ
VTLRVPAGTPSGRTLRARGKGVQRRDGQAGDLLVTVEVQVPSPAAVPTEARDALEQFAKLTPNAERERIEARLRRG